MAIVEVSVVPLGTGDTSLSSYVAKAVKIVQESGLQAWERSSMENWTISYRSYDACTKAVSIGALAGC